MYTNYAGESYDEKQDDSSIWGLPQNDDRRFAAPTPSRDLDAMMLPRGPHPAPFVVNLPPHHEPFFFASQSRPPPSRQPSAPRHSHLYYPPPQFSHVDPYKRQRRQPYHRHETPQPREQKRKRREPRERREKNGEARERRDKNGEPRERREKHGEPRERRDKNGEPRERREKSAPLVEDIEKRSSQKFKLEAENKQLRGEISRLRKIIERQEVSKLKKLRESPNYEGFTRGPIGGDKLDAVEDITHLYQRTDLSETAESEAEWSSTPFETILDDIPDPKAPNLCDYISFKPNLKIKIIFMETNDYACTKPFIGAPTDFKMDDTLHDSKIHFHRGWNSLEDSHLRIVVLQEESRNNVLVAMNKSVSLYPMSHHRSEEPVYAAINLDHTSGNPNLSATIYLEVSYHNNVINCEILGCTNLHSPSKDTEIDKLRVLPISLIMYLVEKSEAEKNSACEVFRTYGSTLWFVIITFSTVGYNIAPCTETGFWINSFFIMANLAFALALIYQVLDVLFLENRTLKRVLNYMSDKIQKKLIPVYEEGDIVLARDDFGHFRSALVVKATKSWNDQKKDWHVKYRLRWTATTRCYDFYRTHDKVLLCAPLTMKTLVRETLNSVLKKLFVALSLVCFGTVLFKESEADQFDDVSFIQTFHFSLATISTIGYGDFFPKSNWGRFFGVVYVFSSGFLIFSILSSTVHFIIQCRILKNTEDFLSRSTLTPLQFLEFDCNGNGVISKYQYLREALLACKYVSEDDLDIIMSKFNNVDLSKSGKISIRDVANGGNE